MRQLKDLSPVRHHTRQSDDSLLCFNRSEGWTDRRASKRPRPGWRDLIRAVLGHAIPEDIEGVLSKRGVEEQVAELEAVAERHTPYGTRATTTAGGRPTG